MKILVRKCKKRKMLKKPLRFIWKIVKKSNLALFSLCFLHFWPRDHGTPGFSRFFDFAVCVGVFYRFPYDQGLFSVIFLHFLQKCRCVPKIGFSADMFLSFSFIFLQKCCCVPKIGFSADIFLSFCFISSEVSLCT